MAHGGPRETCWNPSNLLEVYLFSFTPSYWSSLLGNHSEGGGLLFMLHSFCIRWPAGDLSSSFPGKYLELARINRLKSKTRSESASGCNFRKKVDPWKLLKTHSATSCLNVELCWSGIWRNRCAHQTRPDLSFNLHLKFLESTHWCKNCAEISEDRRFRGQTPSLAKLTQ